MLQYAEHDLLQYGYNTKAVAVAVFGLSVLPWYRSVLSESSIHPESVRILKYFPANAVVTPAHNHGWF